MWQRVIIVSVLCVISNNVVIASYCDKLGENNIYVPKKRYVSIRDQLKNVSIYWKSNESRAASALLVVLLRYKMGYQGVYMHHEPHEALQENEVILALTDPSHGDDFIPNLSNKITKVCPEQIVLGQKQFYVHIAENFRHLEPCRNATTWNFYQNITALKDCGFIPNTISGSHINVYVFNKDKKNTIKTLSEHIIPLKEIIEITCFEILDLLINSKHSFLFVDDDFWSENPLVSKIQLPPCKSLLNKSKGDINTLIQMRFVNTSLFIEYAPSIYQIGNIVLSLEYLKAILEKQTFRHNVDEASCEWALDNMQQIIQWTDQDVNSRENYYSILYLFDGNDHEDEQLYKLLRLMAGQMERKITNNITVNISFYAQKIKPTDTDYVKSIINDFMIDKDICLIRARQQLLGVVLGVKKNISAVIQAVEDVNLPVFLHDDIGVDIKSKKSRWFATGTSFHLALALQRFVLNMNWTRVAVLSGLTEVAQNLLSDIKKVDGFLIQNYLVQSEFSQLEANKLLKNVKNENFRIIFVNTYYEDALNILLAAEELKMTNEYVWIVRDWQLNNKTFNIKHITFSFLSRNITYYNNGSQRYPQIFKRNKNEWPPQAPALMDAVLTLAKGYETVFHKYPQTRHDVYSELAIREFEKTITNKKIQGVTQNLIYDYTTRSLENIVVIFEEHYGLQRNFLARYRVNTRARDVYVEKMSRNYFNYGSVYDGHTVEFTQCYIRNDDDQNTCYDILVIALVGTFLGLVILSLVFKIISRPIYKKVSLQVR